MSAADLFLEGFSPPAAAEARQPKPQPSWVREVAVVWRRHFPACDVPWAALGRTLRRVKDDPRLLANFDYYCRARRQASTVVWRFLWDFAYTLEMWEDPEVQRPGESTEAFSARIFARLDSPARLPEETEDEYQKRLAHRGSLR